MLPPQWKRDYIFFMHDLRLVLWRIWITEYIGSDVLELLSPGFNRSGSFCFLPLKTATMLGGTKTTWRGYMKENPQALINNSSTNCQRCKWVTLQVSTQVSSPNGHHLNWYHLEWKSLPDQFSQPTESSEMKKKKKKKVCGFKTLSVKVVSFNSNMSICQHGLKSHSWYQFHILVLNKLPQ